MFKLSTAVLALVLNGGAQALVSKDKDRWFSCGNGNDCLVGTICLSSEEGAGRRFACSRGLSQCADGLNSCQEGYCSLEGECLDLQGNKTSPVLNLHARRTPAQKGRMTATAPEEAVDELCQKIRDKTNVNDVKCVIDEDHKVQFSVTVKKMLVTLVDGKVGLDICSENSTADLDLKILGKRIQKTGFPLEKKIILLNHFEKFGAVADKVGLQMSLADGFFTVNVAGSIKFLWYNVPMPHYRISYSSKLRDACEELQRIRAAEEQ